MPREKVCVQSQEGAGAELNRVFEARSDITLAKNLARALHRAADGYVGARCTLGDSKPRQPERDSPELAEHITNHLRVAYDELLNEPVPEHLKRLLANLCEAEDKS